MEKENQLTNYRQTYFKRYFIRQVEIRSSESRHEKTFPHGPIANMGDDNHDFVFKAAFTTSGDVAGDRRRVSCRDVFETEH